MSTAVTKREPAEIDMQSRQLEAIKRILSQRTPEGEIRERAGRGGMKLKYTDGAYVIRTLNEALGWDWDFVADSEELIMNGDKPFEVKVRGTLTVRMDGRAITKTQYGCQPIEFLRDGTKPVSIGDAYKGAATDAMKKCASLLGIALDLYDSDYKPEKYADGPEPVRAVKLEGMQPQPTNPVVLLQSYCHKLGFDDAQLLKWLIKKFPGVTGADSLASALGALTAEELSQAIDIFREKLEGR